MVQVLTRASTFQKFSTAQQRARKKASKNIAERFADVLVYQRQILFFIQGVKLRLAIVHRSLWEYNNRDPLKCQVGTVGANYWHEKSLTIA